MERDSIIIEFNKQGYQLSEYIPAVDMDIRHDRDDVYINVKSYYIDNVKETYHTVRHDSINSLVYVYIHRHVTYHFICDTREISNSNTIIENTDIIIVVNRVRYEDAPRKYNAIYTPMHTFKRGTILYIKYKVEIPEINIIEDYENILNSNFDI
jgi:hypothetical protein